MRKKVFAVIGSVLFFVFVAYKGTSVFPRSASAQHTPNYLIPDGTVIRTVDGDTFVVQLGGLQEKVRMLGMDTPETVDPRKTVQCFGKEASKKLHELLTDKIVTLKSDPANDDRDKYGRILRYVYLPDGTFVNSIMIEQGFAFAYIKFPFMYKEQFVRLQMQARAARAGLWGKETCNGVHG